MVENYDVSKESSASIILMMEVTISFDILILYTRLHGITSKRIVVFSEMSPQFQIINQHVGFSF
jgi:hypothetical protein